MSDTNMLGMRQHRNHPQSKGGHALKGARFRYTSAEDQAIRKKWQAEVAARSCCAYAYAMETTTNPTSGHALGLPYSCPSHCPDWDAMNRTRDP